MKKIGIILTLMTLLAPIESRSACLSTCEVCPVAAVSGDIPSEIFAFMERILNQIDSVQTVKGDVGFFLKDKNVFYRESEFPVKRLKELPSVDVSLTNGKWYEVRWYDDSNNVTVSLEFPANYELIYGLRKDEIEQKVKTDIRKQPKEWKSTLTEFIEENIIETDSSLYKRKIENILEIPEMTDNIFLVKNEDGEISPVFDSRWKHQSAVNLLQGVVNNIDGYKLYITQDKYDSKDEFTVDFAQWLNYCKNLPAVIYCGLEEERDDGLKMLLILDVYPLGYRHMLSVILPPDFVEKKTSVLKSKLYSYIPAHNVVDMFYDIQK